MEPSSSFYVQIQSSIALLLISFLFSLQIWKNVQALVGKTGKDGLKRRCLEYDPDKMLMPTASRAKELLSKYGLDDVRDVSAGAATFYVWVSTMCS